MSIQSRFSRGIQIVNGAKIMKQKRDPKRASKKERIYENEKEYLKIGSASVTHLGL